MKLNPPKVITWWVALILGAIGLVAYLVGQFLTIPVLPTIAFWLALVGLALLLLATLIRKGL